MKECCLCILSVIFLGILIWIVKNIVESKEKEKLENKHKKLEKLKLEREIKDLEVEIEFEKDEKKKKLLENEKNYLEKKLNAF